jgi:serine protease AprX
VIEAAEWIYENRERLNIRVANFSLHSSVPNSFMYDPLNRAVEKLWFGGVVVVAAAGNYGVDGEPSDMPFAPANDPFVITVGANDIGGSIRVGDDKAAPWSAYGYTLDGFAKPEVGAPGRYIIGPVPPAATLPLERPGQVRGEGYMELSGTSFAAPLVSGIAAYLLAVHPEWTPDQVKGALMLTAKPLPSARPGSLGVGQVNGPRAAFVLSPPNPNAALNEFLTYDPNGGTGPVFDAASWARVATENASWARVSYEDIAWHDASWARDYWESASWARDSFEAASWASSAEAAASWASASWATATYEDWAARDPGVGGEIASPEEQTAAEEGLAVADPAGIAAP